MSKASGQALIQLQGVGKTYRTGQVVYQALTDLNLEVWPGEYVAIVGPSGSGKSTCMNIIGLLDSLDQGSYKLAGEDVSTLSEEAKAHYRNRFIGFVFQSFNLLPDLSLLDNVALPLFYANVSEQKRRAKALDYLDQVGLADYAWHKPTELSGGQKQRGAIARALINDPALLLADEPTGNLDSHSAQEVLGFFDELIARGRTIVLITHDESAAARAGRRLSILDGHIQEMSTSDQSYTKLDKAYLQAGRNPLEDIKRQAPHE